MKRIYGFIQESLNEWGDVFSDEKNSPETTISSACHTYYDLDGNVYVGFDMSLGMRKSEMDELLSIYSSDLQIFKVLP